MIYETTQNSNEELDLLSDGRDTTDAEWAFLPIFIQNHSDVMKPECIHKHLGSCAYTQCHSMCGLLQGISFIHECLWTRGHMPGLAMCFTCSLLELFDILCLTRNIGIHDTFMGVLIEQSKTLFVLLLGCQITSTCIFSVTFP